VPKILYSGSSDASGFSSNADERIVATKDLYRRNINPLRKVVLDGLTKLFKLIDPKVKLEFVDFEEFREKQIEDEGGVIVDESAEAIKAKSQAELSGTVGGATLVLDIQKSFLDGTTSKASAIAIFKQFYGKTTEEAIELLGNPEEAKPETPPTV